MRTEQPEVYLKEVLGEIAELRRYGEFSGMYELKANFKDAVSIYNFMRRHKWLTRCSAIIKCS